jgi:hypothetical protein
MHDIGGFTDLLIAFLGNGSVNVQQWEMCLSGRTNEDAG